MHRRALVPNDHVFFFGKMECSFQKRSSVLSSDCVFFSEIHFVLFQKRTGVHFRNDRAFFFAERKRWNFHLRNGQVFSFRNDSLVFRNDLAFFFGNEQLFISEMAVKCSFSETKVILCTSQKWLSVLY